MVRNSVVIGGELPTPAMLLSLLNSVEGDEWKSRFFLPGVIFCSVPFVEGD
jgi:hypothetical protein